MTSTTPTPLRNAGRPGDRELGLTMVELAVVVVIILIIGMVAASTVRTGKANGSVAQGRTLARSIGEGIEQFQRDHGGRVPGAVTSADWHRGSPVDAANGNRAYVRPSAIEPLRTSPGFVLLDEPAASSERREDLHVVLGYAADARAGLYAVVVHDVTRGRAECHVTNAGSDRAGSDFVGRLPSRRAC